MYFLYSREKKEMTEPVEGIQHTYARLQVEWYLRHNGRAVYEKNKIEFNPKFVKEHKLGTPSRPNTSHSYDIMTQQEIIEIDDLNEHPKPSHQINDGLAERYIREYHPEYKFYRLLKEEIVDRQGRLLNPKDVADYLRENLF